MRRSRAITKQHAFLYVFHVQPKHPDGAISVEVEGSRPCLSKPSYGAPQWALVARLMQKEWLKSPHKSLFYVIGPFLVILVIFGKHAIWVV